MFEIKFFWTTYKYLSSNITSNDRPFGCPIITELCSQCYFVHWHLQQCLIHQAHWLLGTPYLSIIVSNDMSVHRLACTTRTLLLFSLLSLLHYLMYEHWWESNTYPGPRQPALPVRGPASHVRSWTRIQQASRPKQRRMSTSFWTVIYIVGYLGFFFQFGLKTKINDEE